MKNEKWKKLKDYPQVLISNYGRFFNTKTHRFHSWHVDKSAGGKLYLRVSINKKFHYVHKLVAQNFVKKENDDFNEVDHLDDNGLNPFYKNLAWTDRKGNLSKKGKNSSFTYYGKIYSQKYIRKEK